MKKEEKNRWKEFLLKILNDFNLSVYELSNLTGISPNNIYRIIYGTITNIRKSTIRKIEQGLNIKIIADTDPIVYRNLKDYTDKTKIKEEVIDYFIREKPLFQLQPEQFFYKINFDTKLEEIKRNDTIICDPTIRNINNMLCLIKMKSENLIIGKVKILPENEILIWYNEYEVPEVFKPNEIDKIYPIIGVLRKLQDITKEEEEKIRNKDK
jgi:predicted transcriptional regulator